MRNWTATHGEALRFVVTLIVLAAVLVSFDLDDARFTPLILMVGAFGLLLVTDPLVAVTAAVPYGLLYAAVLAAPPDAAGMLAIPVYLYGLYFLIAPESAVQRWRRYVLRQKPADGGSAGGEPVEPGPEEAASRPSRRNSAR